MRIEGLAETKGFVRQDVLVVAATVRVIFSA